MKTTCYISFLLMFVACEAKAQYWTIAGVADFNGDGKCDLLWRRSTGENSIWFMNGPKVLDTPATNALPLDWCVHGVGDFNGDRKSDILWRRRDGSFGIWLMDGHVPNAPPMPEAASSLGLDWQIGGIADYDSDGRSDILWRRTTTGENSIWFMNAAHIRSTPGIEPQPTDWRIDAVADFDGDGHTDILWRRSSGEFGVWMKIASKVDAPALPRSAALGHDWQAQAVADFDGDKNADVMWVRRSTGERSIWFMKSGKVVDDVPISAIEKGCSIEGHGDLDGDGLTDLVLRDADGRFAIEMLIRGDPNKARDFRFERTGFQQEDKANLDNPNNIRGLAHSDVRWSRAVYGATECSRDCGCSAPVFGGYDIFRFPDDATSPPAKGWQKQKVRAGQWVRLERLFNLQTSAGFKHPDGAVASDQYFLIGKETRRTLDGINLQTIDFGGLYADIAINVPIATTAYYQYPAQLPKVVHTIRIDLSPPPPSLPDKVDSSSNSSPAARTDERTHTQRDSSRLPSINAISSTEEAVRMGLGTGELTPDYLDPFGWILEAKIAERGTRLVGLISEFIFPKKFTRVYRAVSDGEFDQIMKAGKFEVAPGSLEGKWFADTVEGAKGYGDKLFGQGKYKIIEADVPNNAPSLFTKEVHDGMNYSVRYLEIKDLEKVEPKAFGN